MIKLKHNIYRNKPDYSSLNRERGWCSGESNCLPPIDVAQVGVPILAYGLSLLLVLVISPRAFSLGTLVFPSPQKPIRYSRATGFTLSHIDWFDLN